MYRPFLIVCMALGIAISGAYAAEYAVPVVESPAEVPVYRTPSSPPGPGVTPNPAQVPTASPAYTAPQANPGRASTAGLLFQIETLQQEVQTLRGMVEEQAYMLQQIREEQRDRYLDLDRRISLISQTDMPATQTTPTSNTDAAGTIATAPITSTSANEKNDFDQAFNLIRTKQYDNAIASLKQFTLDYPDGLYTANAYYWLGEVEIVKANFEGALSAFGQLIDKYPQHRKIPDALYKQGKLYRRLGDITKARQILEDVISKHPGTSAAKLAESELQSLKSAS